jgi:hypothetical protein
MLNENWSLSPSIKDDIKMSFSSVSTIGVEGLLFPMDTVLTRYKIYIVIRINNY